VVGRGRIETGNAVGGGGLGILQGVAAAGTGAGIDRGRPVY
jgi:hypothetical protein